MTLYKQRYFESDYMGWSWTIREGAAQKIYDKLKDITVSMKALDYLEMPEVVYNNVYVTLPQKAMTLYEELEKEMIVQLSNEEHLTAVSVAVLSNKCLQLANGFAYTESGEVPIHDEKLDALESIIAEAEGQPVLVAYNYKSDLARIKARFKQAVVLDKNPATVAKWNAKQIPLLVAHPASAGHGLNLQEGGNTIAWFGMNWSLELYEQFNARLHRQGQSETVFIHHIIASGTVDEKVLRVVSEKENVQNVLKENLKCAT